MFLHDFKIPVQISLTFVEYFNYVIPLHKNPAKVFNYRHYFTVLANNETVFTSFVIIY